MRCIARPWSSSWVSFRSTRRLIHSSSSTSGSLPSFKIPKLVPSLSSTEEIVVAPPSAQSRTSDIPPASSPPLKPPSPSSRIPQPRYPVLESSLNLALVSLPLRLQKQLDNNGWAPIKGTSFFVKTFKLKGADFRSGVMSRLARYLKSWPSFPPAVLDSISLSTASASLSFTLNPSAAPSGTAQLMRLIVKAIDLEEDDKGGKWFATGAQEVELKELGWKRVWRVKENGWVKENGERERERVLERTFDFTGKEDAWNLMRKTSGRLERVFVNASWRSRVMGMDNEADFDLLIYPLLPIDFPPLLTVQLSPLRTSPPLSLLVSPTKLHPFPRLPWNLRVAAKGVENVVGAQSLGTLEETEASRIRSQEIWDRSLKADSEWTGLTTDSEQAQLREEGWRRVWREMHQEEGEVNENENEEVGREKETALERTFDFEGEVDAWDVVRKAEWRLKRLFLEPEFRRTMGLYDEPNFCLVILPLPPSSPPTLTVQLTPHPASPPLSLLTPINSNLLFHRLPTAMLSAAKIVQYVVLTTRMGSVAQLQERRVREFGILSTEADPDFWAGTREGAMEVMGKLGGGEGDGLVYKRRSGNGVVGAGGKDEGDTTTRSKEDDKDTFEAGFLASASQPSLPSSTSNHHFIPPTDFEHLSPPNSTQRTDLSSLFKIRASTSDDEPSWTLPSTLDVQENNPFRSESVTSTPMQPVFRLPPQATPSLEESREEREEEEEDLVGFGAEEEEGELGSGEGGKEEEELDPEVELRQLVDLVKGGDGGRKRGVR